MASRFRGRAGRESFLQIPDLHRGPPGGHRLRSPGGAPLPGARGGTISTTAYTSMRAREYKLKKGKHVLKAVPRESLDLKSITIVSDVRALEER